MKFKNILETIGGTPLIRINKLNPNKDVDIYVKLEGQNPGGSIKDRIALEMIEEAEKEGKLTKSKTIIEATSGNTGIGLAMVAAVKGYNITITMSEAMSEERKRMLRAFGAKLIETPASEGTDGAIKKSRELYKKEPEKYWLSDQFNNENNPGAHYNNTAKEIIEDMPDITHFVASIGTSGTIMGIGKKLKEYNKNIKVIGVEPNLGHKIAGLKNMKEAIVPGIYHEEKLDEKLNVKDNEAFELSRKLASQEGMFVGMSAGAAIYGAIETAKKIKQGKIVVIIPDRGEKYLSTHLFIDCFSFPVL